MKGWTIPAYTIPLEDAQLKILRVVVRTDLTNERKRAFIRDLNEVCDSDTMKGIQLIQMQAVESLDADSDSGVSL